MSKPIERKVTQGQVEFWLGSDNTLEEAIETLTNVANGDYKPILLSQEVLETCDSCGYEKKANG